MPPEKEELKAKLLAQAESAIEAMLSNPEVNPHMTLGKMEQVVGELGANLEQHIMQELVNTSQEQRVQYCPECGGKLRNKGKRAKSVETVRGAIHVQRDYYTCLDCETGFFPPG